MQNGCDRIPSLCYGHAVAKIHFHTLGCRLNHAESERIARGFKLAGHEIVTDPTQADLRVVNTCTVTKNAGDDSRRAAKPQAEGQKIVVTGCHSQMHPEEFSGADLVVDNDEKEELAALTMERFGMEGVALGMDARGTTDQIYPLALATTRAFVKIQDGCNLNCSFCLTTVARGISRSRTAEDILAEVRKLHGQGCQEVVLTGVHAGSYGLDCGTDLGALLEQILEETEIPRLRMGSLEPWNFRDTWIPLWHRYPDRLCRHLHMSLQSGCASVLRRMKRCYDPETFAEKVNEIRAAIPGMSVTTDVIVGFPGETDEEHQASLAFVESMQFAGAHLFPYSSRPGTAAATMNDQVPRDLRKARYQEMKEVIGRSETAFLEAQIGSETRVLWETESDGQMRGLTDNYLKVLASAAEVSSNTITLARLVGVEKGFLLAETR